MNQDIVKMFVDLENQFKAVYNLFVHIGISKFILFKFRHSLILLDNPLFLVVY